MFAYTIALILVCACAAFLSLAAYYVSRRRALLARIGFFVFYILDTVGIFGSEWMILSLEQDPSFYYGIESPVLKVLLSTGVLLCYWLIVAHVIDEHDRRALLVPTVAYVALAILVIAVMPYGKGRQWSYYSLRQAFLYFTQVYAYLRYRRSCDDVYRTRMARHCRTWIVMWIIITAILVEDSLVILVAPIPSTTDSWAMFLFLSARNVSENVMACYVAYICTKDAVKQLNLRAEKAPEARPDATGKDDLKSHIDEQLLGYASEHGLSNRECEICAMVLEGKNNRSIAQELYLSEGTVKTHVHNIMRKTHTGSRDELKKSFWQH